MLGQKEADQRIKVGVDGPRGIHDGVLAWSVDGRGRLKVAHESGLSKVVFTRGGSLEHGVDQVVEQTSQFFRFQFVGNGFRPLLVFVDQPVGFLEDIGLLIQLPDSSSLGTRRAGTYRRPERSSSSCFSGAEVLQGQAQRTVGRPPRTSPPAASLLWSSPRQSFKSFRIWKATPRLRANWLDRLDVLVRRHRPGESRRKRRLERR